MTPRHTTRAFREDPHAEALLFVAEEMHRPAGTAIQRQEEDGQRQLIGSNVIPTDTGCSDADLQALGFELGTVVDGDPMFRHAVIPDGWTKAPGEDPRSVYIVDDGGRQRFMIFYKAVFYDRSATMTLLADR